MCTVRARRRPHMHIAFAHQIKIKSQDIENTYIDLFRYWQIQHGINN